MNLNVNPAAYVISAGAEMDHMAAGAFHVQWMADQFGSGF